MSDWVDIYRQHRCSAEKAIQAVHSGDRVFLTGNASVPPVLVQALVDRGPLLHDVELIHVLTVGASTYCAPELQSHIRVNALFAGASTREAVQDGRADFTPVYLSDIPALLRTSLRPNVALIQVSPPDKFGYCTFGTEIGVTRAAADAADIVIAEVNPKMPRTRGNSLIHVSHIDYIVEVDHTLPEMPQGKASDVQQSIARHIADLIEDGSTLQAGIGGLPDALLSFLGDKKRLGIHTELFADGVVDLVEKGVITGEDKTLHPGKIVAGFVLGTQRTYDFIHENDMVEMHPTDYVNDPLIIAKNDRMVSINSAIEIDLTGQVCADSMGHDIYSGVGGQVDFSRGAARSKGGKPIIALPSSTKNDTISRIVWELKPGAGISVPRNETHYVVTEYGVAYLYGKTLAQRARAMIDIAHPNFREELERSAREANYLPKMYSGMAF